MSISLFKLLCFCLIAVFLSSSLLAEEVVLSNPLWTDQERKLFEPLPKEHFIAKAFAKLDKRGIIEPTVLKRFKQLNRYQYSVVLLRTYWELFEKYPLEQLSQSDIAILHKLTVELHYELSLLNVDVSYMDISIASLSGEVDESNCEFITKEWFLEKLSILQNVKLMPLQEPLHLGYRLVPTYRIQCLCTRCGAKVDRDVQCAFNPMILYKGAKALRYLRPGLNIKINTKVWCKTCTPKKLGYLDFSSLPATIKFSDSEVRQLKVNKAVLQTLWKFLTEWPLITLTRGEIDTLSSLVGVKLDAQPDTIDNEKGKLKNK